MMTVQKSWRVSLATLLNFVAATPGIRISRNQVSIPADVRDTFYQYFDAVREDLVKAEADDCVAWAKLAGARYLQQEQAFKAMTGLESIVLPSSLDAFLHEPVKSFSRPLFEPLLDVLQEKLTVDQFEAQTRRLIENDLLKLTRISYEAWLAVTIMNQLEPDEMYRVGLQPEATDPARLMVLERASTVSFGFQPKNVALRIPDVVFHSRLSQRFFASRFEYVGEIGNYEKSLKKKKDQIQDGDTSGYMGHRGLLIYRMAGKNNVPLIANRERREVSSPDVYLEYISASECERPEIREGVLQRLSILTPRQAFILTEEPDKCADYMNGPVDVRTVQADLSIDSLRPVVEALLEHIELPAETGT